MVEQYTSAEVSKSLTPLAGSWCTNIVMDSRILELVCPGKSNALGQLDLAIALDLELDAVGVKLCPSDRVLVVGGIALVQPDKLGSEEVASRR